MKFNSTGKTFLAVLTLCLAMLFTPGCGTTNEITIKTNAAEGFDPSLLDPVLVDPESLGDDK